MPTVYLCDGGCGAQTQDADEFSLRGIVIQRRYCADCVGTVDETLDDLDALHTSVAAEYQSAMEKIRKTWGSHHPGGRLPDGTE